MTLRNRLNKLHFSIVSWLFADIINERITEAIHPEFGWMWRDGDYAEWLQTQFKQAYIGSLIKELDKL